MTLCFQCSSTGLKVMVLFLRTTLLTVKSFENPNCHFNTIITWKKSNLCRNGKNAQVTAGTHADVCDGWVFPPPTCFLIYFQLSSVCTFWQLCVFKSFDQRVCVCLAENAFSGDCVVHITKTLQLCCSSSVLFVVWNYLFFWLCSRPHRSSLSPVLTCFFFFVFWETWY